MADYSMTRSDISANQRKYYDHRTWLEQRQQHTPPTIVEIEPDIGEIVQLAFTAHDGAQEITSGRDRAAGLMIRLIPLALFLLVLAVGAGLLVHALTQTDTIYAVIVGALLFGWLCLRAYHRESLRDYEFSRAGLERHRVDAAASLREQEMEYQFRLRKMLLKHQLRLLESLDNDRPT
ncbi:MAG: hypothetical protein KDE46_00535 [Caldilineaceae bacterium]|nr:hypothetical protein [Caldilineaceae bacterium]